MFNPYNCAAITDKAPTLTASCNRQTASRTVFVCENCDYAIPCEWDEDGKPINAISVADGKTYPVYEVKDGQITIKGKRYPIKLVDGYYIIRKLTVREAMRLQTVPEWYEFPVSDSQAYKMLGNGWTVDVIAHIIQQVPVKQGKEMPTNSDIPALVAKLRGTVSVSKRQMLDEAADVIEKLAAALGGNTA